MGVVIDTVTYDVPVKMLKRKAEFLYKYAERTEDGTLHSEMIGTFYNYTFQVGMSANNTTDYALLWTKLTTADTSHSFTILGSTFNAYVANVSDEVDRTGATNYYRNLTFDVIAISPAVTPV